MDHLEEGKIRDVLLEPGEFLVLHIGESNSNKTISGDSIRTKDSEFWFFQVADRANIKQSPVKFYDDSGTARGPLSPNSGLGYGRLYDSSGSDLLRNDEDSWRVYHFSLGVMQDGVRVYPRVPENQNGGGFSYLTGSEPDPTEPSSVGYVESEVTDYEEPATELEGLAWRNGTRSAHQYGVYNTNEYSVDPLLSITGAAYELRPVVEAENLFSLLADISRPQSERDNKLRLVDFSKSALRTFSYSVPDSWKDAQNTLSVSEVNLPREIEKVIESGDAEIEKGTGGN